MVETENNRGSESRRALLFYYGVGAGAFAGDKKNNAGGGMTGKVTPSAVLVIQNEIYLLCKCSKERRF